MSAKDTRYIKKEQAIKVIDNCGKSSTFAQKSYEVRLYSRE